MYPDAYIDIYQKMEGFKIKVCIDTNKWLDGYMSLKPNTRSTYDIAMRDATIDGLITMDNIGKLKAGQIFYRENIPDEIFILQSVNKFEMQPYAKNVNAIKQNSFITVQRKMYDEETFEEKYTVLNSDLISFVTMQNKDEKNFAAGIEDNTIITIQIPRKNLKQEVYDIQLEDRIILEDLERKISRRIKVEGVNAFAVPGVIIISGTFDTRTGEE